MWPFTQSKQMWKTEGEFYKAYETQHLQGVPMEERLKELFDVPDETIYYDSDKPMLNHLRYKSGVFRATFSTLGFWFLLFLNVTVAIIYFKVFGHTTVSDRPTADGWPKGSYVLLSIPTTIISFLMVFIIDAAFSRYQNQYLSCKAFTAILGRLSLVFKTHFDDDSIPGMRETRHSLLKLLVAAQAVAFAALPENRRIMLHLWVYEFIKEKQLLTANQLEHLKPLMSMSDGRFAMTEVFLWISRGMWKPNQQPPNFETKGKLQINASIYEARQKIEYIYAQIAAPIPFLWYNLVSVYLLLYLLLLSYLITFLNGPYYSTVSLVIILVAFFTLRELLHFLSDPFGQDASDIPVMGFVMEFEKEMAQLADARVRLTSPSVA